MIRGRKVVWAGVILGITALMVLPVNGVLQNSSSVNDDRIASNVVATSTTSLKIVPPPDVAAIKTEILQKEISSPVAPSSILGNIPIATTSEPEIQPALAADTSGWSFGGYALQHGILDSDIVLTSSIDGGKTWKSSNIKDMWPEIVGYRSYPAVDYRGPGHRFVATFTPDINDAMGSTLYVITADNPSDTATWSMVTQDCTWVQIHDRESNDIAGYSNREDWWYGIVVSTADSDYNSAPYVPCTNVPFFNLPYTESTSWAWWFYDYENCHHASIDLVQSSGKFYAAWDYYDETAPEKGRDILLVTGDADNITTTWSVNIQVLGGNENNTYPDVAATENGYVYIVAQANDLSTGDQDIICFYSHDRGTTWQTSTIAADPNKNEMYPSITADGESATCVYTVDGNLYQTTTEDGGATWGASAKVNDVDGTVISEYHMGSVCKTGAFWMDNRNGNADIYFAAITPGAPDAPTITGPASGDAKTAYDYKFVTTDYQGDQVLYYVDWGDGTNTGWIGPFASGAEQTQSHTWAAKGNYTITAQAKDTAGHLSGWGTLTVTMPVSICLPPFFYQLIEKLFQRFPNAFPILQHLLGY
jgi:hypothetical protein